MSESNRRLQAGQMLGERFRVAAHLGAGDWTDVYDVRDTTTGHAYVAKVFPPNAASNTSAWAAYEAASRQAGSIPGDVITQSYVFKFDRLLGLPFVVREFVAMPSAQQILSSQGKFTPGAITGLLEAMSPVMDAAHASGMVHGQLKPTNVFGTMTDGRVWRLKITDFGLSTLRRAAPPPPNWPATPGWIAPEFANAAVAPTPEVDVFVLGLMAFFLLTGKSLYLSLQTTPVDLARLWTETNTVPPLASQRARELGQTTPAALDPWFARCWALAPEQRFHSVKQMSQAWANLLASPGAQVASPLRAMMNSHQEFAQTMRPRSGTVVMASPKVAVLPPVTAPPERHGVNYPPPIETDEDSATRLAPPRGQFDDQSTATHQANPADESSGAAYAGSAPRLAPQSPVEDYSSGTNNFQGSPQANQYQAPVEAFDDIGAVPAGLNKKSSKGLPIAAVVGGGIFVMAAAVAAGGYFLFRSRAHTPDVPAILSSSVPSAATPANTTAATPSASAPGTPAASAAQSAAPAASASGPSEALVKITCNPGCDEIKCDSTAVADGSAGVRMKPGHHTCIGTKKGYSPKTAAVDVDKAEAELELVLDLAPATSHATAPVAAPAAATPATKTRKVPAPSAQCGTFLNPCRGK